MIYTVGNAVSIPPIEETAPLENDNSIIFIGKMSYDPNIVAVNYFANEIFPIIKLRFPNLFFTIVGANPTEQVKKLSRIEGIKVTGYVSEVEPYLKESSIVVAPMLTGAGIQNKIIMAMAFGCCVMTTKIGAEGLHIRDEIRIINSADEWIDQISDLLKDKSKRRILGSKAREYVIANLSKKVISEEFWKFMDLNN